jgi:adenine-specific DNA-methyltransferase
VHPKVLIDDLLRSTRERAHEAGQTTPDLFADFNGIPTGTDKTEFYQHDQNWTNRMILGDSLQVMASLAEREGLRGKVQCIYLDPPYGIKFNSNFQWSTTSRDVKDGKADHITREPEQVKAFRDTWRDGIHSYLTYLRDRLTVARDLLTESGSIFVQIGEDNVQVVRLLMDEVFGPQNFCSQIAFKKTSGAGSFAIGTNLLPAIADYIIWYGKVAGKTKYRQIYRAKAGDVGTGEYTSVQMPDGSRGPTSGSAGESDGRLYRLDNLTSQTTRVGRTTIFPVFVDGKTISPATGGWKTNREGMDRLVAANRVVGRKGSLGYVRFIDDFAALSLNSIWEDTVIAGRPGDKTYVVQTSPKVIERCLLMATDPGDLVLDPTCGSGTTATVAEQWGRRWITIDTSRVALALARARIMGARYPVLPARRFACRPDQGSRGHPFRAEFSTGAWRHPPRFRL